MIPAEAEITTKSLAAEAEGPGGGEWTQWGRNGTNNMASPATGISIDITSGEIGDDGEVTDAKGAKWVAKLGSQAYGTPTIYQGQVFVGTNNEEPRIEAVKGDHGVLMAFDEQTGGLNWQFSVPKLGAGKVSDWEYLGICSSMLLDGKNGYVVTNRGEIICLDLYGLADGNDGPFQEEDAYASTGLEKLGTGEPVDKGEKGADIVWGYDMRSELGVFPHNITSSSVVMAGDKIFASTSNGVDWSHINIPAPTSPCLIALNKETGELVAEEASGIGERIMHCNWSSPGYAEDLNGKATVVFGAGDGYVYGFDANEFDVEEDGGEKYNLMKELWKVNCCPNEYRFDKDGEPIKYATYPGPSEIIASPVVYDNKVYVAIGQDPEHGEGVGAITCIDPSKGNGDDAIVWQFRELGRTISTPSIVDGLIYIADYSGKLFCLDAETGEKYWEHDTLSHIWSSTLVVDGKVFLGNEDGEMVVMKAGKEYEEIATIEYPSPIYSTCVVANGTLYVMTQTHLYAYGQK
ncbi:MAG: PQQ-binding-like beta-propeller repeat protein [Verrucomicrobiae bacterium]|nr:PQQ-binding-like beta-propeller repeat protein [Verrucomicrobiae bacterium]